MRDFFFFKKKTTYQGVPLRLLKIVAPVQRIEPDVEKKLAPLALPQHEALLAQALAVLGEHEINFIPGQAREGVDDAVGRHDGLVAQHQRLEPLGRHDVLRKRQRGVHDDGVRGEGPEVGAVRVEGQGVAEGGDQGPGFRGGADVVVFGGGVVGLVACAELCVRTW